MTRRVVYMLMHEPPNDFENKFFVREIRAAGFDLGIWNIGPVFDLDVKINRHATFFEVERFGSFRSLRSAIRREVSRGSIFVAQFSRSWQTLPVSWLLKIYKAKTVFFGRGYLPYVSEPARGLGDFIKRRDGSFSIFAMALRGLKSILTRFSARLTRYEVAFTAGALSERLHSWDAKRLVAINHFDIDRLRLVADVELALPQRYAVFLDEYLPHHPDFFLQGVERLEPKAYYKTLNCAFQSLEKHLGFPVVIAGHPKSSYAENPFDGRQIVFGRTAEMVKGGDLVLAHASTAISFAVIFHRPVILLYSNEIMRLHPNQYAQMASTSNLLVCEMLNMDNFDTWKNGVPSVNLKNYASFYSEYLAVRTDLADSANTVVDELLRLYS